MSWNDFFKKVFLFLKGLTSPKSILVLRAFFFVLGFSLLTQANFGFSTKGEKAHICFFELDNNTTSENFAGKRENESEVCPTEKTYGDTVVHCYQPQSSEESNSAFERMVKSMSEEGKQCDGLVISGHHTGNWYGKKGKGDLYLKFMEALSCKEEYKDWFKNIKALWLDGCNTVTDNSDKKADAEAIRVATPEDIDIDNEETLEGVTEKVKDLQQAYAGSLDENTPLSSRYLRMFPNTQIYGFNGAAPQGSSDNDQVGSRSFIYEHLSHLGKAIKADGGNSKDQLEDLRKGLKALFFQDPCEEGREAWEGINKEEGLEGLSAVENQDYLEARRLGCDLTLAKQVLDNPDSSSAKALAKRIKNNPGKYPLGALTLANSVLNNPTSETAKKLAKMLVLETLKTIDLKDQEVGDRTKDKIYSQLLFNNIYDTWNTAKKYRTKDPNFFKSVRGELKKESWEKSIEERISSTHTASLRKGDYIKFYTEIHDIKNPSKLPPFAKKGVQDLFSKAGAVFRDLKSPGNPNLDPQAKRALAVSVVDQLQQYGLLDEGQMKSLIKNQNLFPQNTKNPFVANTYIQLQFAMDEGQILFTIKNNKDRPLYRKAAIREGTKIYLNKKDKVGLNKIGNQVYSNPDERDSKGQKAREFRQALIKHLESKKMLQYEEGKWKATIAGEKFIIDLYKKGDLSLKRIVLQFAGGWSEENVESLKEQLNGQPYSGYL